MVNMKKICACGCGKLTSGKKYRGKYPKYIIGHNNFENAIPKKPILCKCGCGKMTSGRWTSNKKYPEYIGYHWTKVKKSPELSKWNSMHKGEKSPNWVGEKISYAGIHDWIERILGKPDICEDCGRSGLTKHDIQWANISKEYKRDISDWKRLCAKCHNKFDDIANRATKTRKEKYNLSDIALKGWETRRINSI